MKITEPKLEERTEQPYAGIRSRISMQELPNIIPQHIDEVAAWLEQQGVVLDGPPLVRYHVCPSVMGADAMLDITVGWPVANAPAANGRITAGGNGERREAGVRHKPMGLRCARKVDHQPFDVGPCPRSPATARRVLPAGLSGGRS